MKLADLAIFLMVLFSSSLLANERIENWQPIAGQHYKALNNNMPLQPGVTFYFWPGSASCYQLESALQIWQREHPKVNIERIPLIKRPQWRLLAKAWLVAQSMNLQDNHKGISFLNKLYQTIHIDSQSISSTDELERFIITQEINQLEFMTRFNSVAINQQLKMQEIRAALLPISGVPTIIINNQWITDASMATTAAQLITIIDKLSMDSTLEISDSTF